MTAKKEEKTADSTLKSVLDALNIPAAPVTAPSGAGVLDALNRDLLDVDTSAAKFDTSDVKPVPMVNAPVLSQGRVVMYDAGNQFGPYTALCVFAHGPNCGNFVYWTHEGQQGSVERSMLGEGKRTWKWPART